MNQKKPYAPPTLRRLEKTDELERLFADRIENLQKFEIAKRSKVVSGR